jgi:aerobic-type carbon monoxide dehydrogenase small subunit (CoxS/CutS family)
MSPVRRTIRYDGREIAIEALESQPLLEVLRAELGVRSASRACTDGSCGACRVLLDGELRPSCRVLFGELRDGVRLETYETLARHPAAERAVAAFNAERPTRCRMCIGALGVTAVSVAESGLPQSEAIEGALADATCLCTGRGSWRRALSK